MSIFGLATLNKTASGVFEHIIQLAKNDPESKECCYLKLNNNPSFMELCAEKITSCSLFGESWECWSFAHYYVQCGDLMRDPEMGFLYSEKLHAVIPYMYCMDAFGMYQESVKIHNGTYHPRMQKDHTAFANRWMMNIKKQQGLKIPLAKPQEARV